MGIGNVLECSAAALGLVSHFLGTSRVPQSPGGSPVITQSTAGPHVPSQPCGGPTPRDLEGRNTSKQHTWAGQGLGPASLELRATLLSCCNRKGVNRGAQDIRTQWFFPSLPSSPFLPPSSPLLFPLLVQPLALQPPTPRLNDPLVSVSSQGEEDSSPQSVWCQGVTVLHMKHMHLIVNVDLAFPTRGSHAVRPAHHTSYL